MRLSPTLLVLTALAGPACAATPITPGYWESTNKLLSPIQQTSIEKRCITAADVEKFMGGPSNRRYACTYPTRVINNGKIRLKGACVDKKGRQIAVEGQGNYTPTSFTLHANIAMDFLGLPIQGQATTEAHRIGDVCPPPEKPPEAITPPPEPAPEPLTPDSSAPEPAASPSPAAAQ